VFTNNILQLILQAKEFTNNLVFAGIAHANEEKWQKETIIAYNNTIKTICSEKGVKFIDVLDLLTDADLDDGLHPNTNGHKKLYSSILEEITSL
jgi:lysophospholipase L1-like esterase